MGLIDTGNQPFQPPSITKEQRIAMAKQQLKQNINRLFKEMQKTAQEGWEKMWTSKDYTPQEMIDALGADAVDSFRLHGILVTAIESAQPGTLADKYKAAGAPYTVDEYGKITITG